MRLTIPRSAKQLSRATDAELATWHQDTVNPMNTMDGYDDLKFEILNNYLVRLEAEQDSRDYVEA